MSNPLHQLDPLNWFSDRASDYVKYRPTYPTEAIDQILEGLGTPSQLVAADIGAGTYDRLTSGLTALHQRWTNSQGFVSLRYQTKVFLADPQ